MNILWFTWKDKKHALSGGAELLNEQLAKRLVRDGHKVVFIVSTYPNCKREETIDGYKIIRVGNRYTVYLKAFWYYWRNLRYWPDIIIEEINTIPFFTQWYAPKQKRVLIFYQLCREIWFYQQPVPINLIGYLFENIYLRLFNRNKVITISKSTKDDLIKFGFLKKNIYTFPPFITLKPITSIKQKKYKDYTLLSFGSRRPMKRVYEQTKAYELAKQNISQLKLKMTSCKITEKEKKLLMQKCHIILSTSVKEGWGLTITEAASQGTPAIVYNIDGLRDSVKNNISGVVCKQNTPQEVAKNIIKLYKNKNLYKRLQKNALNRSRRFTIEKSYQQFKKILT